MAQKKKIQDARKKAGQILGGFFSMGEGCSASGSKLVTYRHTKRKKNPKSTPKRVSKAASKLGSNKCKIAARRKK